MLPNFIKVFDFLLHFLDSSFLWAYTTVPTHKERNLVLNEEMVKLELDLRLA